MPEYLSDTDRLLNLEQRVALLKTVPAFATLLTAEDEAALAQLMHEVCYAPQEVWVKEGALVDSVFILVSGRAEVTLQYMKKTKILKKVKTREVPVGILRAGDTIGLNNEGFYSQTGKRTATIVALTEVHALALNIEMLHAFFQERPHLKSAMSETTDKLLRVKLIKQSLPFSRLSHERLRWLSDQVEEIIVPAGKIIFQQGAVGDCCYLIRSGQIEIFVTEDDGTERRLSLLKPPTLFGEATLITRSPRNASARAVETCQLLVIDHKYLAELLETENNVAHMFMNLMLDRSCPLKNPHVTMHQRTTIDKQTVYILKNPDNTNYFKLSNEGWFIWEQLNGKKTMQEITLSLVKEFNIFAPDVVAGLISKLAKAGFISNIEMNAHLPASQPAWVRVMQKTKSILESRIAIGKANKWMTTIYDKVGYLFFTRPGKIVIALLIMTGLIAFGFSTNDAIHDFKTLDHPWILLSLLIPFSVLSVGLHEMGHALATKAFGHEVNYMGVGWYWFGPVAFVDTSDMWLSPRWPRIVVNFAGIVTDLLIGSIAALLVFVMPGAFLPGLFWLFALFSYISAFRMLSPLQELDGYYILMDLFERPHLRRGAVKWLAKNARKTFHSRQMMRAYLPEISYWLACIIFLMLVTLLTLSIQEFIFSVLNIQPASPLLSLMLPFIVVLISSLSIIADLRSQAE